MSQPIKALQFRTKKYAWSLATVSWLLAIGNSSQAIIYRKSLHYIHNSTFIGRVKILISQEEKVDIGLITLTIHTIVKLRLLFISQNNIT